MQDGVTRAIPVVIFLLGVYVIRVFTVANEYRNTAYPATAVIEHVNAGFSGIPDSSFLPSITASSMSANNAAPFTRDPGFLLDGTHLTPCDSIFWAMRSSSSPVL
jgi:hypothetical protein